MLCPAIYHYSRKGPTLKRLAIVVTNRMNGVFILLAGGGGVGVLGGVGEIFWIAFERRPPSLKRGCVHRATFGQTAQRNDAMR